MPFPPRKFTGSKSSLYIPQQLPTNQLPFKIAPLTPHLTAHNVMNSNNGVLSNNQLYGNADLRPYFLDFVPY
jgi:hypothetical protein